MRKQIVAGNWKMNMTLGAGNDLVNELLSEMPTLNEHKIVVIAPTHVLLTQTASQLESTTFVQLGAQNCHTEANGAYTGEVSAGILKSAGVQYVILGHSERRQYFNETNEQLAIKVDQVLNNGMEVIYCCGEPLEIRDAGTENSYVEAQIKAGLFHLNRERLKNVTIAYEPIWAIGTGRTASSEQAQAMHKHIRNVIAQQFDEDAASNISILYGGSCKPSNAAELFACEDVDGGLIGGAALKADEFLAIIQAMVKS